MSNQSINKNACVLVYEINEFFDEGIYIIACKFLHFILWLWFRFTNWICFCSFRCHMTTSIQPIEIKNTVETLLSNTLIDTYLPSWQEMLARNLKKHIFYIEWVQTKGIYRDHHILVSSWTSSSSSSKGTTKHTFNSKGSQYYLIQIRYDSVRMNLFYTRHYECFC